MLELLYDIRPRRFVRRLVLTMLKSYLKVRSHVKVHVREREIVVRVVGATSSEDVLV